MCFKLLTKTILAYFSFPPAGSEFLHAPDWTLLPHPYLLLIPVCCWSLFVSLFVSNSYFSIFDPRLPLVPIFFLSAIDCGVFVCYLTFEIPIFSSHISPFYNMGSALLPTGAYEPIPCDNNRGIAVLMNSHLTAKQYVHDY